MLLTCASPGHLACRARTPPALQLGAWRQLSRQAPPSTPHPSSTAPGMWCERFIMGRGIYRRVLRQKKNKKPKYIGCHLAPWRKLLAARKEKAEDSEARAEPCSTAEPEAPHSLASTHRARWVGFRPLFRRKRTHLGLLSIFFPLLKHNR